MKVGNTYEVRTLLTDLSAAFQSVSVRLTTHSESLHTAPAGALASLGRWRMRHTQPVPDPLL
eukprot:2156220-Pyramimonas_sp.AAC.1